MNYGGKIALVSLVTVIMAGCTAERPFKQLYKEPEVTSKALIDTNSEYLYVPSVVNSPRSVQASRPYWQGGEKIVRFEFTQDALKVYEVEEDPRFSDNTANRKPVLSIPVDHVDFQCSKDSYGKCTHQEEQNQEIAWKGKSYFLPKFNDFKSEETNFLPIDITNLFAPCYTEIGSEFAAFDISTDNLNFQIEKTYKSSLFCAEGLESLSDLSFIVRNHYSFIKLNKITSASYQPFEYSRSDENLFGFFNTYEHKLDNDNNDTNGSEKYYLNRWSPNKTVAYYLNEPFSKPENAKVREATYEAFKVINTALTASGAQLRLELKEPENRNSGDLRNSMIVMVEDPQASGIIGYGPSVANPRTGEIVQARTVMYLGTMKKYIWVTYDEFVGQTLTEKSAPKATPINGQDPAAIDLAQELIDQATRVANPTKASPSEDFETASIPSNLTEKDLRSVDKLAEYEDNYLRDLARAKKERYRTNVLSRFNAYSADLFNFHAAMDEEIKKLVEELGYRPWLALNTDEKQKVIDLLLPYVWVPTLVHELGHNLGLRHNFAGSEDKTNFYSKDELEALGMHKHFPYSSVMDYAYSSTNELPTMGKYDVAALRFAYAEKVELNDGNVVPLADFRANPGLQLKPFDYCTDEHVDVNPNCKRFDEGTNVVEIAQHQMKAYLERYARANFRNNRRNFSLYNDGRQIGYVDQTFYNLRMLFERYESIKHNFQLADNDPLWEQIPFLKELKGGMIEAGQFLVQILKTPDIICAVSKKAAPTRVVAVVPIRALSPFAVSCFDQENISLSPAYLIVGEAGKSFQSRKDPTSNNPYMDQIDIRGIWIDKVLAARYLLGRTLDIPLFDQFSDNFLNIPELQQEVTEVSKQILLDELVGPVEFQTIFGGSATFQIAYGLSDSHQVRRPLDDGVRGFMDLPERDTQFGVQVLRIIGKELPQENLDAGARQFMDSVSVFRSLPNDPKKEREYERFQIGAKTYFARAENEVAKTSIHSIQALESLEKLGEEKLTKIIEILASGRKLSPKASQAEKDAAKLGVDLLIKTVNGELKDKAYYTGLIENLLPM